MVVRGKGGTTTGKPGLGSRTPEIVPDASTATLLAISLERHGANTTPGICSEDCHLTLTRARSERERKATEKIGWRTRGSNPKAEGRRPKEGRNKSEPLSVLGFGLRISELGLFSAFELLFGVPLGQELADSHLSFPEVLRLTALASLILCRWHAELLHVELGETAPAPRGGGLLAEPGELFAPRPDAPAALPRAGRESSGIRRSADIPVQCR